ncbi:MAG: imidazoleglycerol-phosphate dehydratase, partial [Solirubrobacterales bacterium]
LFVFEGDVPVTEIGGFESELTPEFFGALAREARMTLHLGLERGSNVHHMVEAVFKAFALSLRSATAPTGDEGVPSTKGTLTS